MTIDITPAGEVRCLYTEAIPLQELGPLHVRRASNVEFDASTQAWVVRVAGCDLFRDPSRQACLDWEHQHDETILDAAGAEAPEET